MPPPPLTPSSLSSGAPRSWRIHMEHAFCGCQAISNPQRAASLKCQFDIKGSCWEDWRARMWYCIWRTGGCMCARLGHIQWTLMKMWDRGKSSEMMVDYGGKVHLVPNMFVSVEDVFVMYLFMVSTVGPSETIKGKKTTTIKTNIRFRMCWQ